MDRYDAKAKGQALRAYLESKLPVPDARSITSLARKAGLRPTTMSGWWSRGNSPDSASLRLLAEAISVPLSDLIGAYEGSSGRSWVFTDPELEALIDRVSEVAVRRVLAERESPEDD